MLHISELPHCLRLLNIPWNRNYKCKKAFAKGLCYRPHTKYGESNVFTCVCHSVHRVGSAYPQHASLVTWPGCMPSGRSDSLGGGGGGVCIKVDPSKADSPSYGRSPPSKGRPSLSRQRQTSPPPRYGYGNGQYASYWNAYLFLIACCFGVFIILKFERILDRFVGPLISCFAILPRVSKCIPSIWFSLICIWWIPYIPVRVQHLPIS